MDQQSPFKSPNKLSLPPISRNHFASQQESPRMSQSVRGLDVSLVNATPDLKELSPLKGRSVN